MDDASERSLLTEEEERLRKKYEEGVRSPSRLPSSARDSDGSDRLDQLTLPDELRGKMPLTKDKYLVKENPHLVHWERETRKFLRNLSPIHRHRVSAVMIYEWATGIRIDELYNEGGQANSDLRKINQILRFYFGKPYMTHIAGRKVPMAFNVRPGYYIRRHRPLTITLLAEYYEKSLYP